MTTFVNNNLEAALLDQKIAGEMGGKRYCYIATQRGPDWILGIAVENERGYNPIDGKTFASRAAAAEWSNGLNAHLGLSLDAATSILVSTMRKGAR